MPIEINTDRNQLNIGFITAFLSETYWAKGRSIGTMQTLIDHSLNFGVYLDAQQIGYARVVTDYAQFAYLMDVFIAPEHRKQGHSNTLMEYIMKYEPLREVKVWRLATNDAHGLYAKFGFGALKNPEKLMELLK